MNRFFLLLTSALISLPVYAQKSHVHGEGKLDVSIDGGTITLNLELPLDALVGFERAPKNDKEKAALASAEKLLNETSTLWIPTAAAKCTVHSTEVSMPKFTAGEHADVDAQYVFRCSAPTMLKSVDTTIFKQFKRLYRLETQRMGPVGQGAQRLTPKNPSIAW